MNNKLEVVPFERSFASHYKSKYWSKKNNITPDKVFKSTKTKYYFSCDKCTHEYLASLDNMIRCDDGCAYCANKLLCNDENCKECFEKSFASIPLAKNWSDKNQTSPREVFKSSQKKYLFECEKCLHKYKKILTHITRQNSGCPFCANKSLCNDDKCESCFKKSFASHSKSNEWSSKNEKKPRDVSIYSHQKIFFDCLKCGHIYLKTISCFKKYDSGCPYCANQKLCNEENCNICYDKSFASHLKSKYWSNKNQTSPRNSFRSSNSKFLFNCPDCNEEYEAALNNINAGYWCYCTKNKTEQKLFDFLKQKYNNIIKQKTFSWCKKKNLLRFDFLIENLKIIIELDGPQHFKQIKNWNLTKTKEYDKYKMKSANDHNYSIIRIYQDDVWKDKNDWQNKLIKCIKKYDKITNIFIGEIYRTSELAINCLII